MVRMIDHNYLDEVNRSALSFCDQTVPSVAVLRIPNVDVKRFDFIIIQENFFFHLIVEMKTCITSPFDKVLRLRREKHILKSFELTFECVPMKKSLINICRP